MPHFEIITEGAVKKHTMTQELYEGKVILNTSEQSLDQIIYDYYGQITTEDITQQKWTIYSPMLILILELNADILAKTQKTGIVAEGINLFMPNPILSSSDGKVKLWD